MSLRTKQSPTDRDKILTTLVDEFAAKVKDAYPARIKRRPQALKAQVYRLLRYRLPPYPKHPGARPRDYITKALAMYHQQLSEVSGSERRRTNWHLIAQVCVDGYSTIHSEHYRRTVLKQLRDAVHARLKRKKKRGRRKRAAALSEER